MTPQEVISYFKTQRAVAKALGITKGAVSHWKVEIPPLRQLQIEKLTRGRLKADHECTPRRAA